VPATGTVDRQTGGRDLRQDRPARRRCLGRRAGGRLCAGPGAKAAHHLPVRQDRGLHRRRQIRQTLKPFAVRADELDLVQYGSDDTKTHRKIKHILGAASRPVGRLLVSELFTVGQGGWSGFPQPQARHRPQLPRSSRPAMTRPTISASGPITARACRCCSASTTSRATPITSSTAPRSASTRAITPARAAGLRDVLFHHPRRAEPAQLKQYFQPTHAEQLHTIPGHHGHGGQVQMTHGTLAEVLQPALREGYAVAGLVCSAGRTCAPMWRPEAEGAPVILQAGPVLPRAHAAAGAGRDVAHLAENASVPVVVHLDHGYTPRSAASPSTAASPR
jgi:5-deoxy-glucuronate isomerase